MKLIVIKTSSNLRLPVILNDFNFPSILPFTYVVLQLRSSAFNTKKIHCYAILALYRFFKAKDLCLEKLIYTYKFKFIIDSLDEFILENTLNQLPDRLLAIQKFLVWAIKDYEKQEKSSAGILQLKIQTYLKYKKTINKNIYKSLTDKEIDLLKIIISIIIRIIHFAKTIGFVTS